MTSLGQKILGRLVFIKEGRLQTVAAREMFKKCVEPKVSILWSVICFNTDVRYHEIRKYLKQGISRIRVFKWMCNYF